jgi:hypothetical protein
MNAHIGMWRVIPDRTRGRHGKPYWMVGRDEAGGIRFILTTYSQVPRRWKSEQGARDYCAITIALQRESDRTAARAELVAAARAHLPPNWPFPVSAHDWLQGRRAPWP